MLATLTEEQLRAIAAHPNEPIHLIDPATKRPYVILPAETWEKLRAVVDETFQPSEAYAAIDRAFAEGWNAPGMDDYDRYEAHRDLAAASDAAS
jgi:hypothetical protein